jgi:pimeloyl-ACP methyl ester carboxylesterase
VNRDAPTVLDVVRTPTLGETALLIAMLPLQAVPSGCMFRGVKRDIAAMQKTASVRGTVTRDGAGRGDILVVAHAPGASEAADVFTLLEPGQYLFTVPAGEYRIVAFGDANRNRAFEAATDSRSEPIDVRLAEGEHRSDIDLHLSPGPSTLLDIPRLPEPEERRVNGLPDIQVGTIATLGDPRFSAENGRLGMWEPVAFMFKVGAGIYLLEPCDESRTPVLFVHGIGGSPAEFQYLAGSLDRQRFQPWFVYYPSGFELDRTADGIARWMQVLRARCDFDRLVVVAHSMGGLVARAFIERAAGGSMPAIGTIDTFVSMSTPWGGHSAAALGVERAPAVVPAWRDLAPGSPFLDALLGTPLPRDLRFYLFFGFGGERGSSRFLPGANDGVVTVASELDPRAQSAAIRMFGYNETHRGILNNAAVATQLRALLERE